MKSFHTISVAMIIICLVSCANRHQDDEILLLLLSGSNKQKSILVLGDSLTDYSQGFHLDEFLDSGYQVQFKGALNKDIPYWNSRIPEALATTTEPFDLVIFPMGTNDAFAYVGDSFVANLHDFHKNFRQYSGAWIVYCQVPRTKDPLLIPKIQINNQILSEQMPTDKTRLIDLDSLFEGTTNPELLYESGDPLHPSDAGYRLIGRSMQSDIERNPF